tara:strand:- start:6465 stop:7394 length:930 start_codon:yes stop_codon:yes gene_type:complete
MKVVHIVGTVKKGECGVGDFVKSLSQQMGSFSRIWHPSLNEEFKLKKNEIAHLHAPSRGWANEFEQIKIYSKIPKDKRYLMLHEWSLASPLRKLQYSILATMSKKVGFSDQFEMLACPLFKNQPELKAYLPIGSSFDIVLRKNIKPQKFRLVFFGFLSKSKDMNILSKLFNYSVDLGWDQPVIFTGNRDDSNLKSLLAMCKDVELRKNCSIQEISNEIKWGDVGLLPFVDGTSARRTTLLSLLKMGIPVLSPPPYKPPFKKVDFPNWNRDDMLHAVKKNYITWTKKQNKIVKIFSWENVLREYFDWYEI